MCTQFYAYLWTREDGTPYYAGKGSGRRAFNSDGHNVRRPKDKSRISVFNRNSEQEALDTEMELIRNWGRKDIGTGLLHNRTDGGDGTAGYRFPYYRPSSQKGKKASLKTRELQSEAAKTRPCLIAGNEGISHTEEHKARMSESLKRGYKPRAFSEETRQKMSAAKIGRSAGMLGKCHSEQSKQQMSEAHKGISTWNKGKKGGKWTEARRKAQEDKNVS